MVVVLYLLLFMLVNERLTTLSCNAINVMKLRVFAATHYSTQRKLNDQLLDQYERVKRSVEVDFRVIILRSSLWTSYFMGNLIEWINFGLYIHIYLSIYLSILQLHSVIYFLPFTISGIIKRQVDKVPMFKSKNLPLFILQYIFLPCLSYYSWEFSHK